MLKLCGNAFATLRVFKSGQGEVNYRFIEDIINCQDSIGLKLANKLSKRYLQCQSMKMKVRLAAEVSSQ